MAFAPIEPDRLGLIDLERSSALYVSPQDSWWREWPRPCCPSRSRSRLLAMGLANIVARATSDEVEDGVLWVERSAGVVAAEVARRSAAAAPASGPATCCWPSTASRSTGAQTCSRCSSERARRRSSHLHAAAARLARSRRGRARRRCRAAPARFYYVLAAVGIFTLLVGAAVRARRPFDQATLHFFWLAVAFFGAFTFSFTGRFDRVDWFFYWADAIALLMLPPLFLHFALVFPERPHVPRLHRACWRAGCRRSTCRRGARLDARPRARPRRASIPNTSCG